MCSTTARCALLVECCNRSKSELHVEHITRQPQNALQPCKARSVASQPLLHSTVLRGLHHFSRLHCAPFTEAETALLQRNALPLLLTAAVGSPDLTCDASGTVMFKPTCLGASTQRALTLHNPSCIAAHYQVRLLCSANATLCRIPGPPCIVCGVLVHTGDAGWLTDELAHGSQFAALPYKTMRVAPASKCCFVRPCQLSGTCPSLVATLPFWAGSCSPHEHNLWCKRC